MKNLRIVGGYLGLYVPKYTCYYWNIDSLDMYDQRETAPDYGCILNIGGATITSPGIIRTAKTAFWMLGAGNFISSGEFATSGAAASGYYSLRDDGNNHAFAAGRGQGIAAVVGMMAGGAVTTIIAWLGGLL